MKIAICASMFFSEEMVKVQKTLESLGHTVILPDQTESYINDPELKEMVKKSTIGAQRKIDNDFIRKHYIAMKECTAILVLNYDKKGIKNYIGANTFLEMGFAHILNIPIYLINEVPQEQPFFLPEILAMQPIIVTNDLNKIL